MSRANPISLRIASKTQSLPFIGVSEYYFYNHVKQNINYIKLTALLSKQTNLPTKKHNVIKDSFILNPNLLPLNTTCIAKQLFSTKYTLNKRRFSSTALHYIRWLHEDFDTNYTIFNTEYYSKYENSYKSINLITPIAYPSVNSKQSSIKKDYGSLYLISKSNQISTLYKYFVFNRAKKNILKSKEGFPSNLTCLSGSGLNSSINKAVFLRKNSDCVGFNKSKLNSKFFTDLPFVKSKNVKKTQYSDEKILPVKLPKPIMQNFYKQFCFKPYYANMTCNMLLLMCLNLLYPENQAINKITRPITGLSLTNQLNIKQRFSTVKKQLPSSLFFKINKNSGSTRYKLGLNSGFKTKSSRFNKVQKHTNSFYTAKSLASLELVVYRSFCEPAGLNYITALENRLSKSRFNSDFSNATFTRTSKNRFISNYTNIQTGLIRLKAQMIFEFLYTKSNSDTTVQKDQKEQNNSSLLMQEPRNNKLWYRKGPSIRL
uniref:Uncharacterized protein n=1 Tax=Percursaria percursa TaxID=153906 RepID=A0A8K1JA69_9CHLO|nr:hypothetical protein [Percursaria percursa]